MTVSVVLPGAVDDGTASEVTADNVSPLEEPVLVPTANEQRDLTESQLDDSAILAAASGGDVEVIDESESQMDELDSDEWDVVSSSEEYVVIEAVERRTGLVVRN